MKRILGVVGFIWACSGAETVGTESSAQFDCGSFLLKQGPASAEFEVGWMTAVNHSGPHGTATETWVTYKPNQQFGSGFGPYGPPSLALPNQHTRALYQTGTPQYQIDTFVVECTVPSSGGITGPGATLTVPTLFEPGIYDLQQGPKVGVLVVEPLPNNIVIQHWVLWQEYVWPGVGHTNVNTKYVRKGGYVATDIQALINAHPSVYILGAQTFGG